MCMASEPFDILLSDVIMPAVNGHEVVRWVARHYETTRCVLMTGYDNMDCNDCPFTSRCSPVRKPFTPQDVVGLIGRVLEEPAHQRALLHVCAD